jgi:hypothetical protein
MVRLNYFGSFPDTVKQGGEGGSLKAVACRALLTAPLTGVCAVRRKDTLKVVNCERSRGIFPTLRTSASRQQTR